MRLALADHAIRARLSMRTEYVGACFKHICKCRLSECHRVFWHQWHGVHYIFQSPPKKQEPELKCESARTGDGEVVNSTLNEFEEKVYRFRDIYCVLSHLKANS